MSKPYHKLLSEIKKPTVTPNNNPNNTISNIDGVLITSPHNLRYYSGFTGGEGVLLISSNLRCLFVDSRYTNQAEKEAEDFAVIEYKGGELCTEINNKLKSADIKYLGFEDTEISFYEYNLYKNNLSAQMLPINNSADVIRMIKTDAEISILRTAEKIGDTALTKIMPMICAGTRECDIATELEYQMRKLGGEKTSFDTIVVSGEKSAMPHGMPDEKKLKKGDFVTLDFGCVYKGYCSDMTRTFIIGEPTNKQLDIYNTVLKAQQKGLDTISAGTTASECDKAARDIISDAGYGRYFGHSLGHGVGLKIHEMPNLTPKSDIILKRNMVVTCEPGIYIKGIGGVRIEDMVVVTDTGCEVLSSFDKNLIICK